MQEGLHSLNGHEAPDEPIGLLSPPVAYPELGAIEAAYAEVRSRDTALEKRLAQSHKRELALVVLLLMFGALVAWFFVARTQIQAFVQVVQVDEDKKVYLLGEPQALLSYTPPEGMWLDMLGEWVRKVRWRGNDAELAHEEWRWAYFHVCKDARAELKRREETEKPFDLGKRRVAVHLKSITKSEVPKAYTVLWEEVITEGVQQPTTQRWTGTFNVGRMSPPTLQASMYNRLGLCINAFNISPMS